MSTSLQVVVALDDEIDRGLIETVVGGSAQLTVLDYLEIGGPTASNYGTGDVLVIACADYRDEVGRYAAEASRQHPDRPVVLMCPGESNGYLASVFETGIDDVVWLPQNAGLEPDRNLSNQLAFTLEKAVIRRRGAPKAASARNGRLIPVLGLKGGSGKTLVTTNLGVALAQAGRSVVMLDLDLQFGDLALTLGLRPERTLYDLVRSGGSLDADKLEDYLLTHSSGARALLAPVSPDQSASITVPFLREVERLLRERHDFVLIDTPPNFTPELISAVDSSTDVIVVAMQDTLSLKNTKLGLETLERMEYDRSRIRLVLNRANTNVGIEHRDVHAILGRPADVLVPSHRDVTRSVNRGEPIVLTRGSSAGKSFRELAQLYLDEGGGGDGVPEVPFETTPPSPRLSRMFGRGR